MIHLELQPELEAQLLAEANARGVDFDRYVKAKLSGVPSDGRSAFDREAMRSAAEGIRGIRSRSLPGPETMKELIEEGRKY